LPTPPRRISIWAEHLSDSAVEGIFYDDAARLF